MNAKAGRVTRASRVASQLFFLSLFVVLMWTAGQPGLPPGLTGLFFHLDPLILLASLLSFGSIAGIQLLALIPLGLTLLLGRFFCGWLCPLGTLNHFLSWLSIRFARRRKNKKGDRRLFWIKYAVLLLVLVTAALGSRLGLVLDPMSLLTRSAAVALGPETKLLADKALPGEAGGSDDMRPSVAPSVAVENPPDIPEVRGIVRAQVEIVGVLFLVVLLLNFVRRRFYCNVVCPLGALYGLVARLSPLRFKAGGYCDGCLSCARYCSIRSGPNGGHPKEDCLLCFGCVADCPKECIELSRVAPGHASDVPVDIGKRKTVGALASGVFLAGLPAIAPARTARMHGFVRPPGSLAERDFLDRCVRCGECVHVCPTNFLQSAGFEAGIDGLWTPIAAASAGFCDYECTRCTGVCPTKAIELLDLIDKQLFKLGTAVIDRNLCLTYGDGVNCTVCADHCPVPDKAIRFRYAAVWTYRGERERVNQAYVVPDLCNGCGACQYACPRTDSPGIVLTSDGEQREYGF